MKLQTQIPLKQQPNHLIDYASHIALFGSCFVENIGERLAYYKYRTYQNPFGILFHPLAIEQFIRYVALKKTITADDVFFHNEQWHSFLAHSKLSHPQKTVLLKQLNHLLTESYQFLQQATHVVITLGTAWGYKHHATGLVVANCHKLPQSTFKKELSPIANIVSSLQHIFSLIKTINSKVKFVLTISPVRHLKDGFIENTQSKSHLISAVHQVLNKQVCYFPSFELMMDELRDYRFYADDMLHPNTTAIAYIWERFKTVMINPAAYTDMEQVEAIQKGLLHRPFNANSKSYQQFLDVLSLKKEALQAKHPFIAF